MTNAPPLSSRLYDRLLGLYPEDLRRDFGADMALVFAEDLDTARREAGLRGVIRMWRVRAGRIRPLRAAWLRIEFGGARPRNFVRVVHRHDERHGATPGAGRTTAFPGRPRRSSAAALLHTDHFPGVGLGLPRRRRHFAGLLQQYRRGALDMLDLRDPTKRFGGQTVVNHVNFTVRPGEIAGYLGPNGSGKSTTVKMMADLLHQSLVSGLVPMLPAAARRDRRLGELVRVVAHRLSICRRRAVDQTNVLDLRQIPFRALISRAESIGLSSSFFIFTDSPPTAST
jgi:hypothetical protein